MQQLKQEHAEAGFAVNGPRDVQPRVTRVVDRLASFLTITGLASLLIGGIGVALAIQNYLTGKVRNIATLKCVGAESGMIFKIYLLQVLALAAIGITVGLIIGQILPFIVRSLTEGLLPVQIRTGFYPIPLLLAAGCGLATTLAFAIWPLASAKEISPAGMFRALLSPTDRWPRPAMLALFGGCLFGLALLAIIGVSDKRFAFIFIGVAIAAALLLTGVAKLALMATKHLARGGGTRLRMAIANLHRPGAHATSVVVALGAGLAVLTLVAVINQNMRAELDQSFASRVPSVFFSTSSGTNWIAFRQSLRRRPALRVFNFCPRFADVWCASRTFPPISPASIIGPCGVIAHLATRQPCRTAPRSSRANGGLPITKGQADWLLSLIHI